MSDMIERQYDFITKLAEGKLESSPKSSWWARHEAATTRYLLAVMAGKKREVNKAQAALFDGCIQWELLNKNGMGFMAEHGSLEIAFLNSVEEADQEAIEIMGTLMLENAIAQARQHALHIQEFPEARYLKLLEEHISLTAQSAQSVIEKNESAFHCCEDKRIKNALYLAEFTTEWL